MSDEPTPGRPERDSPMGPTPARGGGGRASGSGSLPPLGLSGRILAALSRRPGPAGERGAGGGSAADPIELRQLDRVPDLEARIAGRRVLDFGCGGGGQVVALARKGAKEVVGLDIQERLLRRAEALARSAGVADRVRFVASLEDAAGAFDVVVSRNSMEHFADPSGALVAMKRALVSDGRILITFGPTWLSPWGAHMDFFAPIPWVHLLFPERAVMAVRARHVDDGATRYEEVTGGLNRMTVGRFRRLVREAGLTTEWEQLGRVRGLKGIADLPGLRELLTNEVTAILRIDRQSPGGAEATRGPCTE